MSQEKQFCRNCGKRDLAFSQEDTVRFWEPGLCSECHRLPIIGTHYDVFTGERIQPQITWQIDAPPDTSLSIETNAQDVVTRIEPTPKHDGKLDHVDDCMQALGLVLNLLDPDGSLHQGANKEVLPEKLLRETMQAVKEEYGKLSDAILALRKEQAE